MPGSIRFSQSGLNPQLKTILWVAAAFLIAILLSPIIFGRIFVYDDLLAQAFPWRVFYAYCLRHSKEFFWMPSIFNGYYFHGEGQVGLLHPIHLLIYRFLSADFAFQIEVVLPYIIIFLGFKLWLQKKLNETSALFGAFCFMTSSFCALRMVHPNALQVVAHYPWLLIALDHFLDSKEVSARLRGVFEWALLMGSMILIGYPQYVLISVFLQLIYIFVCFPISKILSSWKLFCVGAISGLAIGAAQLLPTWEYFTDSERTLLGIDFVGWGSLNPLQFFQWFGPYVYKGLSLFSEGFASGTHEYGLYEGVFAVFAILWSLFEKQRNLGQAQWFRLAVILMVVGLFLSLGKYNGVFYLYGPLKPFSFFRYHSRTRVLLSLGVSLLSALAFDDLVSSKKRWVPKKVYLLPGIMSVLIALVAIAIKVFRPDLSHQFFSNGILLVTPLAFLILGSIFYMGGTDKKWFPIFLVLFVVLDRAAYQLSFAFHDSPKEVEWKSYGVLQENRKLDEGNWRLIEGARLINGYLGVAPKRGLDYSSPKAQQASALEGPNAFSRYWVVGQALLSKSPSRDIEGIDLSKTALVEENLDLHSAEVGKVKKVDESPGYFKFVTQTQAKQLLVVSESFHSGWQARIDGFKSKILRVNGDFMGIVLEPGEHEIKLFFRPWSVIWGLWISGVSLVIVFVLSVLASRAKPSHQK